MSKYTTEVRFICETFSGLDESADGDSVDAIIESAREKIFTTKYPIFDENYRTVLESKILKHYYTREIAHETVGLWKLRLNTKMNEVMPYFNQLYKSALLEFNPFCDTDVTRNKDGSNTKTGSNAEATAKTLTISNTNSSHTSETTHDSGIVLNDENATNTGSLNNSGTISNDEMETNNGTVKDDGLTTNDLKDTKTATNTVDKTTKEDKLEAFSDTPQGGVSNLEDYNYLTTATKNANSGTGKDTEKINESLAKTGTIDANNTTTTDMTRVDKNTNTTDMTQTSNSTVSKNTSIDTTNDGTKSGDINGVSSSTHNDTTNVSGNTNVKDIESYIESVKGKQGTTSYSELLLKFRETFLNIDMLVIGELNELFFNLW